MFHALSSSLRRVPNTAGQERSVFRWLDISVLLTLLYCAIYPDTLSPRDADQARLNQPSTYPWQIVLPEERDRLLRRCERALEVSLEHLPGHIFGHSVHLHASTMPQCHIPTLSLTPICQRGPHIMLTILTLWWIQANGAPSLISTTMTGEDTSTCHPALPRATISSVQRLSRSTRLPETGTKARNTSCLVRISISSMADRGLGQTPYSSPVSAITMRFSTIES
jgi:hypothetical protein